MSKLLSKDFDPLSPYTAVKIYCGAGSWYVYFFYRGKMFKKSAGLNRIKDKKKRLQQFKQLAKALTTLLENRYNPTEKFSRADVTLRSTIVKWKDEKLMKLKSRSRSTLKSGITFLLKFMEAKGEGNILVSDITKTHILTALSYWQNKLHWTNRSYNNHLSRWRTFFNWLINQNSEEVIYLERNPTERIPFEKVYPTDRNRPPTEEEFSRIVNHLYQNDKPLFLYAMFIYYAGFRVTETGLLQRWRFEFSGVPHIRLAAKDQKDNETSIQIISPHLLAFLYELKIDKLPGEYYLFSTNMLPGPVLIHKMKEKAEERWRKEVKTGLGIKVDLYSLKHKQATELGEAASDEDISKFLRHSDIKVTKSYMRGKRAQVPLKFFDSQRPLPLKEPPK